jgi:Zn-dependent protease
VLKKISPTFLALVGLFIASGLFAAFTPSLKALEPSFGLESDSPLQAGVAVFVFVVLGWLVSTCLHEFAHAWVAFKGGDVAVKGRGYLMLDPLKYMDPLTSLVIPVLMLVIGGFALPGAAVFINRNAIRTRKLRSYMSLAGPAANLLCFFVCVIGSWLTAGSGTALFYGFVVLASFQAMAVVLNLLPIPGLDGWGAMLPWLPRKMASFGQRYQSRIFWVFILLLIFTGAARDLFVLSDRLGEALGMPRASTAIGFTLFRFWS